MKVLHVIGGGEFGGAEQHILSLMNHYTDHATNAVVVTFYDSIFAERLRVAGHTVITLDQYGRFGYRLLPALVRVMREHTPHIVHTHGVRANFFGRLAAKRAHVPHIVTTVHSNLRQDYPNALTYSIAYLLERITKSLTNHYVVVSDQLVPQLHKNGISNQHISVIPNGIDTRHFIPTAEMITQSEILRKEWQIPEQAFIIGTNARLVPVKALHDLIDGLAIAVREDADVHLVIAGDGPERESLLQRVKALQLEKKVALPGFRNDVVACLALFDCYINCSLSEGTPISVMEAMAAKKALILTAVGGMPSMAEQDVSALFIPPQSPTEIAKNILRLKRDPQLREQLGQNAKTIVEERYSIQTMTQKQLQIYHDLLKGK